MGYSAEILKKAGSILERRREDAVRGAEQRQQEAYARIPALESMEKELARLALEASMLAIQGEPSLRPQITALQNRSLDIQQKIREALIAEGLSGNSLDVQHTCPKCKDTGYLQQETCSCLQQLRRQLAFDALSDSAPAAACSFDTFSLDFYPDTPDSKGRIPRRGMERVFSRCQNYARDFHPHAESLLFSGDTGLGKTHLSLAIGQKVLDKGYGVLYISTYRYIELAERFKFQRDPFPVDIGEAAQACDLLILDDLGAEFSTAFSVAALQSLLNQRLSASYPTIISTNLDIEGLGERYGERLKSRLLCGCNAMQFSGKDIRFEIRKRQLG